MTPGFWLASEGNAGTTRNRLIQVDREGQVLHEITLPDDVDSPSGRKVTSNGFEGVTVSSCGRYLLVAVQRPYSGETTAVTGVPRLNTRIARYDLELKKWDAFFYPLESSPFTIGLSEIVLAGTTRKGQDVYAVIERDNQLSANGLIKRVYTFTLDGLTAEDIATPVSATLIVRSTVSKRLLKDVQPQFTRTRRSRGSP